jgi:uncharacterized protein YjbJ (UPF0337 family)
MNRDRFEGGWKQFAGKVKEAWCVLTGDMPGMLAGRRDQRAGRMQERQGISSETLERQFEEFLLRNRDWKSLIDKSPLDSIHGAGSSG